jgi:hypothetical protein
VLEASVGAASAATLPHRIVKIGNVKRIAAMQVSVQALIALVIAVDHVLFEPRLSRELAAQQTLAMGFEVIVLRLVDVASHLASWL